jgi:hypothetical protein
MDEASFDTFAARLNHDFSLRRGDASESGEPIAAVLVECSPIPDDGRSSGYTLTFRAASPAPAEQANYLVDADGLTPTQILLVPLRTTPDGVEFHAVFNQLHGG